MRERILFIGKDGPMGSDIADAIRKLGHECLFFDQRSGITYHESFRRLMHRIPPLSRIRVWDDRSMNRRIVELARSWKPTLLLVWNGDALTQETIREIRAGGTITVNWFLDLMTHWDIIRRVAGDYHWFFTPDRYVIRELEAIGITGHIAPFAYTDHYPSFPEGEREYPISFVGSYHPKIWRRREECLEAVADFGVNIWGPPAWAESSLRDHYHGAARGEAMMDAYRRSRIVIDVPWDHLQSDAISIRPYEATAAGACLFFYDIRPDMHSLFEPDKEYIPFTTTDELRKKAAYYLGHPEERERIARAGYKRFMQEHTYVERLRSMIAAIRATP